MLNNKLVLVIFLIFVIILLGGCSNNREFKYNNCVKSCKDNQVCVKNSAPNSMYVFGQCIEYNTGDCINICTQKYK